MSGTKLFLLGSPRVERDGVSVEFDTRKAVALLAYLAIARERQSRDALAGLLCHEYSQSKARAALRRTLSALSGAREEGWLVVDRESVGLSDSHLWIDVDRFHELLAECRLHGHLEAEVCSACLPPLTEAVVLYRDDFLFGFGLRDSFNFDDWQYLQTESLRRELAGVLDRLVRGHGAREEWEPAIGYARRRLTLDPQMPGQLSPIGYAGGLEESQMNSVVYVAVGVEVLVTHGELLYRGRILQNHAPSGWDVIFRNELYCEDEIGTSALS